MSWKKEVDELVVVLENLRLCTTTVKTCSHSKFIRPCRFVMDNIRDTYRGQCCAGVKMEKWLHTTLLRMAHVYFGIGHVPRVKQIRQGIYMKHTDQKKSMVMKRDVSP